MPFKRIVIGLVVILVALLLVEGYNLLHLSGNISRFASYWQQRAKESGQFTYVALGDSAAQGIGASSPEKGYVGLVADRLAAKTGKTVRVVNLSVSGAQIEDVINKQLPQLKNYSADLITVEIGSNNVTHWDEASFTKQYGSLAASLPKNALVANIPYFGGRLRLNAQAIAASNIIAAQAAHYGLKVVDLQTYTKQRQSLFNYSADLFHPSNRGYRNWAAAFWQVIEPQIK